MNHGKSNIVVVGTVTERAWTRTQSWELAGGDVEVVDEYKYLGAETGKVRGRWNSFLARIWSAARKHCNQVLWMAGGRRGLRPRSLLHLWSVYCRPKVEYASELWEGVISESWASKLDDGNASGAGCPGQRVVCRDARSLGCRHWPRVGGQQGSLSSGS